MAGNAIPEALEPFAATADDMQMLPDDEVLLLKSEHISDFTLTVGDLRRARTAYDAIGSGLRALDELGTADEWKTKREELQDWTGSAWLAGETDDDHRPELYGFLCGLIGWMHCAEDAARALSTPTASGAGPLGEAVGEAVAWLFEREGDPTSPKVSSGERLTDAAKQAGWKERPLYASPVEEPGEVERFDFDAHSLKVDLARQTKRAETAEAALAETRERLEEAGEAGEVERDNETYEIGKRDGYEEAVQHIDERTGGDGEYVAVIGGDPEGRNCPDAPSMVAKIVARFEAAVEEISRQTIARGEEGLRAEAVEAEVERLTRERDEWKASSAMYEATAAEGARGIEALEEIDAAWDAFGTRGNRNVLTLAEQIASLDREVETAEAALAESEQNAQGLASDLAGTQADLAETREEVAQLTSERDNAIAAAKMLTKSHDRLRTDLAETRERLEKVEAAVHEAIEHLGDHDARATSRAIAMGLARNALRGALTGDAQEAEK